MLAMVEVAPDVWQFSFGRGQAFNMYLAGGLIVDAGFKRMGKKMIKQLDGRTVTAHTLTHAHPDHIGGSATVCKTFGVDLWAPEGEADAAENARLQLPLESSWATPLLKIHPKWEKWPVARRLAEGDDVGEGFQVVDTPGHAPGHVSYWRPSDRVLIVGDVFLNQSPRGGYGLREPARVLTVDPQLNRQSMKKLVALDPDIAMFGHGPPITKDAGAELAQFVETLS